MDMFCYYTYPQGLTLTNAFWTILDSPDLPDITQHPSYSQRVQAECDWDESKGNCILHIQQVTRGDAKKYYCRIESQTEEGKWLGGPGATLSVTGAKILLLIVQKETQINKQFLLVNVILL